MPTTSPQREASRSWTRQVEIDALKFELEDLSRRRQTAKAQTLDVEAVAESYSKLPRILDEVERAGAAGELRTVIRTLIDVVEWRQDAVNPKQGIAEIQLYELPDFWASGETRTPHQTGVVRFGEVSQLAPRERLELPT